jgi:hypothetical protein
MALEAVFLQDRQHVAVEMLVGSVGLCVTGGRFGGERDLT